MPIASFVNCMDSLVCYPLMEEARGMLSEREWRIYGIDGPDGNIKPTAAIGDIMRRMGWGWHDKVTGDGFGHVIHQWASVGRPLIGHASHYAGKLAEPFWQDGRTCINLDHRTVPEVVEIIKGTDARTHREMCEAMREVFAATVDFEADAERVRELLA
jgi:hypothetical protein